MAGGAPPLHEKTYARICEVVYARSGIHLGPHKQALVCARLGKRLRQLSCGDYEDYLKRLLDDEAGDEVVRMLDAITTNVTSFFRESAHFDFLRDRFAEALNRGERRWRLWSAACSSGEEPYTLAMTLLEAAGSADIDVRVLATDLSTRILEAARRGTFPPQRVGPIPKDLLRRYFHTVEDGGLRIDDRVRRMVHFARMNLIQTPYPMRGPMDVVFCRNVMIYFDVPVRTKLLAEFRRLLRPGGWLMVGHSESLAGQNHDGFRAVQPSVYQRL
jgi:chemotaxis protein methyltransferase CheR